jgi:DNA polymerase-3 subunit delta
MPINNCKNIKLWFGSDAFSISSLLHEYTSAFLEKNRNAEISTFDFSAGGNRSDLEKKLYNALRGASLFSSEKIVIIKNLFSSKKNKEDEPLDTQNIFEVDNKDFERSLFEVVAKNSSDQIFFIEERALDKRSRAFTFFSKILKEGQAEQREFLIPLHFEFNVWLEKAIKERGGQISKKTVDFLAMILGKGMEQKERGSIIAAYDLFQSSMEIDKLVAYCDGKEITEEDIMVLVSSSSDMNIFNLIESIGKKNRKRAIEILSGQIEQGFNENYILTMLVYHFRSMIMVKSLIDEGMDINEIVRKTKMHPMVVQKNIRYCRTLSSDYLLAVYGKLYNADISIKNGTMDPELTLDLLVAVI